MTQPEFETHLATALRLCRAMASARLPIEAMLAYVDDQRELGGEPALGGPELDALRAIIEAVGDVAAIGERLPAEPAQIRVPSAADGSSVPLPTNLTA